MAPTCDHLQVAAALEEARPAAQAAAAAAVAKLAQQPGMQAADGLFALYM